LIQSETSIGTSEHLPDQAPIIELQSITKSFGRFQALHDVSVAMPTGVTGLLGPNGAGKSTLIKILLGLLRATSGKGSVLGMPLWGSNREIRQAVGYMPEDDCYLPSLSGVECVQFAARLNCIPAVEALRRSHEILDFCGAGQERYRNVETYSTGMRQKLKFAQAIVHDPPLLILDEPTAGLDPDERDAMLERSNIAPDKIAAFALATSDVDGNLDELVEKPDEETIERLGDSAVLSMNCWLCSPAIFAAARAIPMSARGEYEITDAVRAAIDSGDPYQVVRADVGVLDMSSRGDVASVMAALGDAEVRL